MTLAVRVVAFDLDGTLYRGAETVPGAVEVVRVLRRDHAVIYVTNSTVRSRATIAADLERRGFPGGEARVYTSAASTADYLRQRGFGAVYVVGQECLTREMEAAGVRLCTDASRADALVVGLDDGWRSRHPGLAHLPRTATFVACNLDGVYPAGGGVSRPGCGAVVAEIRDSLRREVDVVVGKPGTHMLDLVLRDFTVSPSEVVLVGDNEASDVAAAVTAGWHSVLIAPEGAPGSGADFVIASITELRDLIA